MKSNEALGLAFAGVVLLALVLLLMLAGCSLGWISTPICSPA